MGRRATVALEVLTRPDGEGGLVGQVEPVAVRALPATFAPAGGEGGSVGMAEPVATERVESTAVLAPGGGAD